MAATTNRNQAGSSARASCASRTPDRRRSPRRVRSGEIQGHAVERSDLRRLLAHREQGEAPRRGWRPSTSCRTPLGRSARPRSRRTDRPVRGRYRLSQQLAQEHSGCPKRLGARARPQNAVERIGHGTSATARRHQHPRSRTTSLLFRDQAHGGPAHSLQQCKQTPSAGWPVAAGRDGVAALRVGLVQDPADLRHMLQPDEEYSTSSSTRTSRRAVGVRQGDGLRREAVVGAEAPGCGSTPPSTPPRHRCLKDAGDARRQRPVATSTAPPPPIRRPPAQPGIASPQAARRPAFITAAGLRQRARAGGSTRHAHVNRRPRPGGRRRRAGPGL